MDTVAVLAEDARADLFLETGARRGLPPSLVEKDFWVCWTLHVLFNKSRAWPRVVFKGGTSLSKGYGAIKRFSEDIDLSINRHDFGFGAARDPANASLSGQKRKQLKDELRERCAACVTNTILPDLQTDFAAILGRSSQWSLDLDTAVEGQANVVFRYPHQFQSHYYCFRSDLRLRADILGEGDNSSLSPSCERPNEATTPVASLLRPGDVGAWGYRRQVT